MIKPKLIGKINSLNAKNDSFEEFLVNKLERLVKSPNGQDILKEHSYYIWFDTLLEALRVYKIITPYFERYEIKLISNTIFFKNEIDINYIKLIL